MHSLTHSLTHSHTHTLTHSLTHHVRRDASLDGRLGGAEHEGGCVHAAMRGVDAASSRAALPHFLPHFLPLVLGIMLLVLSLLLGIMLLVLMLLVLVLMLVLRLSLRLRLLEQREAEALVADGLAVERQRAQEAAHPAPAGSAYCEEAGGQVQHGSEGVSE
jgi:hypothetical protein